MILSVTSRLSDEDDDNISMASSRRLSDFDSEDFDEDDDDIVSVGSRSRSATPKGDRRRDKSSRCTRLMFCIVIALAT